MRPEQRFKAALDETTYAYTDGVNSRVVVSEYESFNPIINMANQCGMVVVKFDGPQMVFGPKYDCQTALCTECDMDYLLSPHASNDCPRCGAVRYELIDP